MGLHWERCFESYKASVTTEVETERARCEELEIKVQIHADLIERYKQLMAATPAAGDALARYGVADDTGIR